MLQLSWSMLRTWEECRQKAYRQLQRKRSEVADTRNFFPGTVADRLMRHWLELDDPQPGWMEAQLPSYFERYLDPKDKGEGIVIWRDHKDRQLTMNLLRDSLRNLEPILADIVLPFDYHPELRFTVEVRIPYLDGNLTKIALRGGIDIAVRRSNKDYRLYDLKLTRNPDYVHKTLGQSVFYDIGFGHFIGDPSQPTEFGFILPAPEIKNQVVDITINDQHRKEMMSRIISCAHGMWKKDWSPKETTSGCHICDVRHCCTKYHREPIQHAKGMKVNLTRA